MPSFRPLRVDVVGQAPSCRGTSRWADDLAARRRAPALPAVVDVDVLEAVGGQAARRPWRRRPRAPWRRRPRRPQTFHEFQPIGGVSASLCSPATIVSLRDARPARAARPRASTTRRRLRPSREPRDDAGLRVERQALGQALRRERERAFAGGRDAEQERPARASRR